MEAHQAGSAPATAEAQTQEQTSLDRQYRRIGISALVAALRYQAQTSKEPQPADRSILSARNEAA
jgi:hypothetical protein